MRKRQREIEKKRKRNGKKRMKERESESIRRVIKKAASETNKIKSSRFQFKFSDIQKGDIDIHI